MGIGKRISELRKKHGLTQEQFAEMLCTTRQAVSKWESGKTNPDLDYVIGMGKIFGVSMDYLLLGKETAAIDSEASGVKCHIKYESKCKHYKIINVLLLATGILILLLCPLFATVYRNYISDYGPAVTDPYWYLDQWPLVGVRIAGILLTCTGIVGLSRQKLRKLRVETVNTWKEN